MKTIETIQTVETTITRIPVKNLVISPLNVRKKQGTGIEELAALIASQGLIHNLVVTPQLKKGKQTGKQEVVAGGRRLAALNLLIANGWLPKDHEVDSAKPFPGPRVETGRQCLLPHEVTGL